MASCSPSRTPRLAQTSLATKRLHNKVALTLLSNFVMVKFHELDLCRLLLQFLLASLHRPNVLFIEHDGLKFSFTVQIHALLLLLNQTGVLGPKLTDHRLLLGFQSIVLI